MQTKAPLNVNEMTSALQQVFKLMGELEIKGEQAQLLLNLRSAVAEVNNSLVHFMQEATKKQDKLTVVNGKDCEGEPPAAA